MVGLKDLNKIVMTDDIVNNHDIKEYFSGKNKQVGDEFFLACLYLPDNPELQIVVDICMRDIDDGTYTLNSVKVNGTRKLGFFRITNSNEVIESNLKKSYELHKTEDKLETVKFKLDQEIKELSEIKISDTKKEES